MKTEVCLQSLGTCEYTHLLRVSMWRTEESDVAFYSGAYYALHPGIPSSSSGNSLPPTSELLFLSLNPSFIYFFISLPLSVYPSLPPSSEHAALISFAFFAITSFISPTSSLIFLPLYYIMYSREQREQCRTEREGIGHKTKTLLHVKYFTFALLFKRFSVFCSFLITSQT